MVEYAFDGEFGPVGVLIEKDAYWTILAWSDVVVLVNKLPLAGLRKVEIARDLNAGSGTCSISVADPNRANYDIFQAQDEIEVFFNLQTVPPQGRKMWGGYIDNYSFGIESGQSLDINGKEYSSRLQSRIYTGPLTGVQLQAALKTLMATQDDFTYEGIPATLTDSVTLSSTADNLYGVIKQACDQWSVLFWINPETRDFTCRLNSEVIYTSDSIIEGMNLMRATKVSTNSEYLTNQIVVTYDGATATAVTDSSSQNAYGVFGRSITTGNISAVDAATAVGQTIVDKRKNPNFTFELESLFLPYTNPGDFILVQSPTLGLNNAFQVMKITHTWSPQDGLRSKVMLDTYLVMGDLFVADLEKRLKLVEKKAFTAR